MVENFSKLGLALFVFLIPEVSVRAESAPCQPVTYEPVVGGGSVEDRGRLRQAPLVQVSVLKRQLSY